MSAEPGRSFGVAAQAYERGRPEWPDELLAALPLTPEATVLDIGAGTGKLTRLLAQRFARVLAVEPDDAMRAAIDVGEPLAGTAEAIPLEAESVDGVFVGEAFHWFDPDPAVSEIARVLRGAGVLALLWNMFDPEDYVLPEGVVPASTSPKHDRVTTGEWKEAFRDAPFEPFREASVEVVRDVPRAELLDYFASVSQITSLPEPERRSALDRIAVALDRSLYRRRWTPTLYWTRRA